MEVEEKLDAIAKTGHHIAWDGCHKHYIVQTPEEIDETRSMGYGIFPAAEIRDLWESSCGLKFVNLFGTHTGVWTEEGLTIEQFEGVPDEDEYDEEDEDDD